MKISPEEQIKKLDILARTRQKSHDLALEALVKETKTRRKIQKDFNQLKKILAQLLKTAPHGSCEMFSHSRKTVHCVREECQPLNDYHKAIDEAENFLNLHV